MCERTPEYEELVKQQTEKFKPIEVVTCFSESTSDNFLACVYVLKSQRLPYKQTHDTKRAMTVTRGCLNPSVGFVILDPYGNIIARNAIELARWIDKKGLTLC